VFHGQLGPPPSRVRNPVREPELSGHGERLPHAHHQPRRTPCAAANRARPGPRRTRCWCPDVRPGGCCGPSSPSTPSTLWPALSIGTDGAPARCAHCLAARHDHWRDGNRSDKGTLGFGTAVPHRSVRRHDGVRRLRQHRRGGVQGLSYPPCSSGQEPQCRRRRRVVLRLRQRTVTRHLGRVRGVGLLRRAGPSDVLAVP
jgi:hypothetical protein